MSNATSATNVRDPDLCVITCAVTGVLANRKQCAGIPYTAVEIAEECKRAYDAGAAVVHTTEAPGSRLQAPVRETQIVSRGRP